MPLPFRPAPLVLLVALLGAGSMAMASPQQQHRRGNRPSMPQTMPQDSRPQDGGRGSRDNGESRRPPQQRPDWTPQPPQQPPRRNEDGMSDSVRRVEQRTRGQVLSAEPVPYDGRNLNRIKVVDDRGRVRVYMDDPQQQDTPQAQGAPQQDQALTRDNDD
jgi:hypothetical protein